MLPLIPIIAAAAATTALARQIAKNKSNLYQKLEDRKVLANFARQHRVPIKDNYHFNPNTLIDGVPLLFFLLPGNHRLLTLLLEYGADPNIRDIHGVPALIYAAKLENPDDYLALLIEYGANPNAMDSECRTAIFFTKSYNNMDRLWNAGADFNAVDNTGKTALFYIIQAKNEFSDSTSFISALDSFVHKTDNINIKDNEGKTAAFYITNRSDFYILYRLEKCGLDIYAKDNHGRQFNLFNDYILSKSLQTAVINNNFEEAFKALEAGADPNTRHETMFDWTMITIATHNDNIEMIQLLVAYGGDINWSARGSNPLIFAVKNNREDCVKALLDLGADYKPAMCALKMCTNNIIKSHFIKHTGNKLLWCTKKNNKR